MSIIKCKHSLSRSLFISPLGHIKMRVWLQYFEGMPYPWLSETHDAPKASDCTSQFYWLLSIQIIKFSWGYILQKTVHNQCSWIQGQQSGILGMLQTAFSIIPSLLASSCYLFYRSYKSNWCLIPQDIAQKIQNHVI